MLHNVADERGRQRQRRSAGLRGFSERQTCAAREQFSKRTGKYHCSGEQQNQIGFNRKTECEGLRPHSLRPALGHYPNAVVETSPLHSKWHFAAQSVQWPVCDSYPLPLWWPVRIWS